MAEVFDFATELIVIVAAIALSNAVGYFIGIRRANRETKKKIYNLEEEMRLIRKTLIMRADYIDEQTKKAHPGATANLRQLTKDMLERNDR